MADTFQVGVPTTSLLANARTPADFARAYLALGFSPIPYRQRDKFPPREEWQHERWKETDIPEKFSGPVNVGIHNGEPSGNLVDVDLDCTETVAAWPEFAPETHFIWGRQGKPKSHWLYLLTDGPTKGPVKFKDPTKDPTVDDEKQACLLEYRAGTNDAHGQSMAPPSIHPNGEQVRFDQCSEIGKVSHAVLYRAVELTATTALLARLAPGQGARNEFWLTVSGALTTALDPETAQHVIETAARIAGDEEAAARGRMAHATAEKRAADGRVTGWPKLREEIGEKAAKALREWTHAPASRGALGLGAGGFPETESGNGELFAHLYGAKLRFNHREGRFMAWRGNWWERDNDGAPHRHAKELARERLRMAADVQNDADREKAIKWALQSESRKGIESTLALGRNEYPITDTGEGWDSDPLLLGVGNGVVNLKTGRADVGRPEQRISLHTSVNYNAQATCPTWNRVFAEIFNGDADVIKFVRCAFGYSLTGLTREQRFFVGWGNGANGKGTLFNTVAAVMGQHALTLPSSTLIEDEKGAIPTDIADLQGARFALASEIGEGKRLNEERMKQLTGEDTVPARKMRKDFFRFRPTHKLFLLVNHKPRVTDDTPAFWRRMELIEFGQQWETNCPNERPDCPHKHADKQLDVKLRAEYEGILNWLVQAAGEYLRDGLKTPEKVRKAVQTYRQESNILGPFLDAVLVADYGATTAARELWAAYMAYADAEGTPQRERLSQTMFGRRMRQHAEKKDSRTGVLYLGVRLRSEADPADKPGYMQTVRGLAFAPATPAPAASVREREVAKNVEGLPISGEGFRPISGLADPRDARVNRYPEKGVQPSTTLHTPAPAPILTPDGMETGEV